MKKCNSVLKIIPRCLYFHSDTYVHCGDEGLNTCWYLQILPCTLSLQTLLLCKNNIEEPGCAALAQVSENSSFQMHVVCIFDKWMRFPICHVSIFQSVLSSKVSSLSFASI